MAWIPSEAGSWGTVCLLSRLVRSRACKFLHSNDGVHQREFRPNQRTLSEVTLPMRFVISKRAPPKPLIRGTKVCPALNAPTKDLKNSNAQWLAASWAHLLLPSTIVPHGRDCSSDLPDGRFVDRG